MSRKTLKSLILQFSFLRNLHFILQEFRNGLHKYNKITIHNTNNIVVNWKIKNKYIIIMNEIKHEHIV